MRLGGRLAFLLSSPFAVGGIRVAGRLALLSSPFAVGGIRVAGRLALLSSPFAVGGIKLAGRLAFLSPPPVAGGGLGRGPPLISRSETPASSCRDGWLPRMRSHSSQPHGTARDCRLARGRLRR